MDTRTRALRLRLLAGAAAGLATLGIAACGGPGKTTRPAERDRVYTGLKSELPPVDPSALRGFSVLIDPGHGGHFRGTVGQDSLEESRVNLGVSLYLWGLLREAGADVYLTRAVDRDFLSPTDSSLTSDLATRVAMVDSLEPDIFVSIHHNAQPERDPSVNRIETYYKAGDPASLDLAFAIHRHLMRNLGIDVGEVRQGNYYVLRNVRVAAVLGESSYLTHPPVERQLRLAKGHQLEAEAYFLGMLDYCRRGVPRVTNVVPVDSVQIDVPVVTATFEDRGGAGIDPDGVTMTVNGEAVTPVVDQRGLHATHRMQWDAPNGNYEVQVSARNLGGNTSSTFVRRFALVHAPAMVAFDNDPEFASPGGSVRVRVRVLDRRGLAIADGSEVTLTRTGSQPLTAFVSGGAVEYTIAVPSSARGSISAILESRGMRFEHRIPVRSGAAPRTVFVRDAVTREPVRTAALASLDSVLASGSPSGSYSFVPAPSPIVHAAAPGYQPARVDSDTLSLVPWFGGVLHGKRFVIDPEGGPPRTSGVGPMGLSSAHVNLRVANYLAGFLRAAGGEVRLTRTSEEVRLVEDIARMTNRFRADLYLELRHPTLPQDSALALRTYFFPGSANGLKIARTLGNEAALRLGVPHVGPVSTVTYPLQQTACPAIVVAAPQISDADEEARLDRAGYLREQAYALFIGLLRHYGVADTGALNVSVGQRDRENWLVTLDDTWTLATGANGMVRFYALPRGEHRVTIRRGTEIYPMTVNIGDGIESIRMDTMD